MKEEQNIFIENIRMQTETIFAFNGNVFIYPCSFELGRHVTPGGGRVSQKGRMVTEPNGTSRFVPYRRTGAPRYRPIYSTASTLVKMSDSCVIVETRIPRRLCAAQMRKHFRAESAEVSAYLKSPEFTDVTNPQNPQAE